MSLIDPPAATAELRCARLKRCFDVIFSLTGLVLLSRLFLLAAILVKGEDGGPVWFRQERIGLGGRPFRMWKFRSMVVDAERKGTAITVGADGRITRVGRWLRRTKVDELPQLINVLAGTMSLVGPRPEVRRYTELYSPEQNAVLAIKPGVTDPASIKYRDENDILAASQDPEHYYIQVIIPDKIRINLEYARQATLWSDTLVILRTLGLLRREEASR
jgi:lipopolysaccharide/colanic/teichoic acid biosynthesis glycosyltransferase